MIAFPPGGSTWAEPPPEIIPTSECAPITAMLEAREASSGSCACSFLSSTMLCSSMFCATFLRRIIDNAAGKHRPQDAVNVIVHFSHGNLAGLYRFLHGIPVENFARFLVI